MNDDTTRHPLSEAETDALGDEIATDAAILDSGTYALLVKIRRFDDARGWARQGAESCAHWLSWRTGLGIVAARQKIAVAHRLVEFPRVAEAFRRGQLSYTKVRAVVRENMPPEKDEVLLHQALGASGAQMEKISAAYRGVAPGTRPTDDDRRYVRKRRHRDGTVSIEIRLLPDEAERVYQALGETKRTMTGIRADAGDSGDARAHAAQSGSTSGREGWRAVAASPVSGGSPDSAEPGKPTLVDAAVVMAEAQLARLGRSHAEEDKGDEKAPADKKGPSAKNVPAAERRQLFVHLSEDRIDDTSTWNAELHDGTPLGGETLRRLACDAGLVVAKTDQQGDVLDIGRRRRTVSPALLRALLMSDRHCQFPGCGQHHQAFLDAHHLEHWLDGGPTNKDNTALLCHAHHVAVHEGGFSAKRRDDGSLAFYAPDGRLLESSPPVARLDEDGLAILRNRQESEGIEIDYRTSLVRHNGAGLDLHAAVGALFPTPKPAASVTVSRASATSPPRWHVRD